MRLNHQTKTKLTQWGIPALVSLLSIIGSPAALAEDKAYTRQEKYITLQNHGVSNPIGLAYSSQSQTLFIGQADQVQDNHYEMIGITLHEDLAGSQAINADISNPANISFDPYANRILLLNTENSQDVLITISTGDNGSFDRLERLNATSFGLVNPQGMTVDTTTGVVYILDAAGPSILRVEPDLTGSFSDAQITEIDLSATNLNNPQGIAFNPNDGHLYVLDTDQLNLVALSLNGQVQSTRNLSELTISDPKSMVFAPSGDLTDDETEMSLFISNNGDNETAPGITEVTLIAPATTTSKESPITSEAVTNTVASLENLIKTFEFAPPSPDPSGIGFLPDTNTLLICDGEIEEEPVIDPETELPAPLLFEGYNLFEMDLNGSLTGLFSTVPQTILNFFGFTNPTANFSDEPTGISEVNPTNNHIFLSDDDGQDIFEIDPSTDGLYGTADDIVTSFSTVFGSPSNSLDPEGVSYVAELNALFIVDGANKEVYKVTPGDDGFFDTVGDNEVSSFDTEVLGMLDPEGIAYSAATGNLFIISSTTPGTLFEISTSGALVREIDISAATSLPANHLRKPAGLAFVPNTVDPTQAIIYIVDRANDNNIDVGENDGLVFEMSFPFSDIINHAPTVNAGPDQNIFLEESGSVSTIMNPTVTDDGFPSPPNTVTLNWSKIDGPGIVGFSSSTIENPSVTFTAAGIYALRLTASDSDLQASDDITITVNSPAAENQPPTANAGPDQTIIFPASATLDGTASDDGLPIPPGTHTTLWSKIDGPGDVTFGDETLEDTTASFSVAGTYILQLETDDGALQTNDQLTIIVADIGGGSTSTIEQRIATGSDDAEERTNGSISLSSSDIELVYDSGNQTVGLRFNNLSIPVGSVVVDAYLQFETDETNSQSTTLTIEGEASSNATTFTSVSGGISARPRTSAFTQWLPVPWTTRDEQGEDQKSPNIAAIVQEIIGLDWTSGNSMVFIISGSGERTAESFEGDQSGAALLHIEYASGGPVTNQAPTVDAGADQDIAFSTDATLTGIVTDDGLPTPATLTTEWTQTGGPDTATIVDPSAVDTTASFPVEGTYIFKLTASDGELEFDDEVSITVTVTPNEAPTVNAGTDQGIALSASAILDGTVNDDGLPVSGALTTSWTKITGPGIVEFADDTAVDTTASFFEAGTYELQLTATDGEFPVSDEVTIIVTDTSGGGTAAIDVRVSASSDDAEENASGKVFLTSSDLELVFDKSDQTVGMRFNDIILPPGAIITNAYLQFQTDETAPNNATNLTIEGEAVTNAVTFASVDGNISMRPRTGASTLWSPDFWTISNEAGLKQRSPDISSIIQEIINLGWSSGNSMVLIITGTGERTAESYNGNQSAAPLLHIEYATGPASNQAPIVNAGADHTVALSAGATLNGTITDDGLPAAATTLWSKVDGPGIVGFTTETALDTTVSFDLPGLYILKLTAVDGEFQDSDEISITVNDTSGGIPTTIDVRVSAGSDDAEETGSGKMYLTSSDIEMVFDNSNQTVGLRFNGLAIPAGSIITNASVQFQVDETNPQNATDLIIEGEAVANTGTFTSINSNISSRLRTLNSESWSPAAWTVSNEEGADQQTPDISAIIQEIVDSGATTVDSLVLIITGTGERTAESFEGESAAAALLHVEFIAPAAP